MILDNIKEMTMNRWMAVAMPGERIFILYLATAVVMAFFSWLYYRHLTKGEKPDNANEGFLRYILRKDVLLHRSAIQDYLYFLLNGLIYSGLIAQLLISTHFFMVLFYHSLEGAFGEHKDPIIASSLWTLILYTVIYTLFLDFAIFITHLAQHKIPVLWEFHKVHHSAEVLTPVTLYRMHPVDLFFSGIVASLLAGLAFAGFYYLTSEEPVAYEIMGLNIVVFLFYLLGYNLRHSQVWLSYPQWLSHILISPAQHQIHHSTDPRHFDKNMGLIFAFWDKIFGTLYVPKKYEKISYGINKKQPNPFRNVGEMYWLPFRNAWKILTANKKSSDHTLIVVGVLLFCVLNYALFYAMDQRVLANDGPLPSVHIEDLTWSEVQRGLDERGYDTIIIPTGGTEQNGIHHNAEEIAKRLGGTLVAPEIAYVPEDMHMPWAGTISLPENVFEGLLEATAESYITHGFKNILFIGDSYDNQAGQKNVAEKLSKKHKDDDVNILQISDYYSANGQMQWLLDHGYTKEQIGGHAGIRDTSEMMYIHPEGLRSRPWAIKDRMTGSNGDRSLASRQIGKKMTELKIDAALADPRADQAR